MLTLALTLCLAAGPDLAGKWEGNGFTLVLEANGSGTMSDGPMSPPEPIKWKLGKGALLITEEGETTSYAMSNVTADSFTLKNEILDGPITLKKAGKGGAVAKAAPAQPFVPGTCQTACAHYLECSNLKGAANTNACVMNCVASGANAYQLGVYNQLDCKRAIMIVVAAQLQAIQQAQNGNNAGSQGKGSRCAGCVRDGNECVWISQSNWGTGNNSPYSGAVSSCDADCCN
ncbi:MAG: hypothetical protein U0228_11560 [Myxococcaceae bacterium]